MTCQGTGKHYDTTSPYFFPEHEILGIVLTEARLVQEQLRLHVKAFSFNWGNASNIWQLGCHSQQP